MTDVTNMTWQTNKALRKRACMIGYRPKKGKGYPSRGWYVREYHSPIAMKQHLKGEEGWDMSYGETGPFRTEEEAMEYAMGYG
jgi:hypothetical protein